MAVTNGYCTLAQLRTQLDDTGSILSTELLERAINATSRAIDRFAGRRFWLDSSAQAKLYKPDALDCYELDVDDIGSTTGFALATDITGDGTYETTWATTDYDLEPMNADKGGDATAYAWWRIVAKDRYTFPASGQRRATVQVTAKWGWSAVPVDVEEACLIKASRLFERRKSPLGFSAALADFGPVRISRSDADVMELLHPYVKFGVGDV